MIAPMNSLRFLPISLAAILMFGAMERVGNAYCAEAKTNGKAAKAETNSSPAEVAIPLAMFDYAGKGVKDPFFPLSTRSPHLPVQVAAVQAFNPSLFKLKGLSGTADSPLALINNRTVAPGESALVTTVSGTKYKIHCLEIKKISVIIRVEGQFEPIEVFLPKSDR
jgi:hypothetical protein